MFSQVTLIVSARWPCIPTEIACQQLARIRQAELHSAPIFVPRQVVPNDNLRRAHLARLRPFGYGNDNNRKQVLDSMTFRWHVFDMLPNWASRNTSHSFHDLSFVTPAEAGYSSWPGLTLV